MKHSIYIKLSAIASFLSGLLLVIGWTLNINRDSLIGALMVLFAYVIALFAFMGIYGVQYKKLRLIGFLGFVFIIIACALFTPWLFLDIARISGVAPQVDWLEVQENGPTSIVGIVGGVGFVVGFLFLAIDTIRAKIFNKWSAIILIIAGIMPLIYTWLPIGKLLPRIAGIALIGFGFELWEISKSSSKNKLGFADDKNEL